MKGSESRGLMRSRRRMTESTKLCTLWQLGGCDRTRKREAIFGLFPLPRHPTCFTTCAKQQIDVKGSKGRTPPVTVDYACCCCTHLARHGCRPTSEMGAAWPIQRAGTHATRATAITFTACTRTSLPSQHQIRICVLSGYENNNIPGRETGAA